MKRNELKNELEKYEDLINFGSSDDSPSLEWLGKAEKELGIVLPDDYKWFLNEYGGGEICGEEIYSIYCMPFNEAVGGDLVYQNTIANKNIPLGKIVLSNTDFGEEFYFKVNDLKKVYVKVGDREEVYAENFIEYVHKRLISYI